MFIADSEPQLAGADTERHSAAANGVGRSASEMSVAARVGCVGCESAEPSIRCEPDDSMLVETPLETNIVLSSEVMQELRRLVRAELVHLNLAQQTTKSLETTEIRSKALPCYHCRSCGASVPSTSLFCPKCDLFQGRVATERCHDDKSHFEPENLAPPLLPASRVHVLQPQKRVQMYIGIAMAFAAGLTLSVVHARTVNTERHVNQPAAISLSDGAVGPSSQVFSQVPVNFGVDRHHTTETKSDEPQADSVITTVRRVEVIPAGWGLGVVIVSSRSITPRVTKLEDPLRVVIDLQNALLTTPQARIPVASQGVTEVRASQYQVTPPMVRIAVQLTTPIAFSVRSQRNKWTIWFTPTATAQRHQP